MLAPEGSGDSSGTPRPGSVTTTQDQEKKSRAFCMQLDCSADLGSGTVLQL